MKKILVVEDDHFYAQLIAETLTDRNIVVVVVGSAQEALSLSIGEFDGVITDVMLPNEPERTGISNEEARGGFSTGIALARRLLQLQPSLPIVILSSDHVTRVGESWARQQGLTYIGKDEGRGALIRALSRLGFAGMSTTPMSFIVHGHDEAALFELKDFIQNTLNWQPPVILREQASGGKTIIEKFEESASSVDVVFVLLTPDDKPIAPLTNDEKRRSRQNVVFELGFFYGSLGRGSGRVLLLHKGPIELPSDISGIVYIDISGGIKAAGEDLRKELKNIGLLVTTR